MATQSITGIKETANAKRRSINWVPWALLAPALILVGGFFVVPLLFLVRVSLYDRPGSASRGGSRFYDPDSLTFKQYGEILGDSFYLKIMGSTLVQAALVTLVIMLLAYPCAMLIHRLKRGWKSSAILVVMLPKLTNLLVLTYGLLVMLSNSGLVNTTLKALGIIREPLPMFANLFAVIIAETLIIAPYPILIMVSLFESLDPALEQAARGMGASPLRAFYETGFKLTLPGAITAAFISFIWAVGAYIGPVVMGSPDNYTVAVQVFEETFSGNNWPLGAALAVSNVLLILGLLIGYFLIQQTAKKLQAKGASADVARA
jgi:ABC-type spermidine/putrescine transport system permease subunit I